MKKTLLFASVLSFALFSCGEKNTTTVEVEEVHATNDGSTAKAVKVSNSNATSSIIDAYLAVKDALVADDQATASAKSSNLVTSLKAFDSATANSTDAGKLKNLQTEATALAEKLASGDIASQRESFQSLSGVVKDMLKIAGSDRILYHQYCPMYKNNTGGMWLSASEEIKNPLFGNSMLKCGRIEETMALN